MTPRLLVPLLLLSTSAFAQESRGEDSRPATRKSVATFADGRTSSGWLPMEVHLDGLMYLRGKLNGVETEIILDSGTPFAVVDAAFADRLGLKEGRSVRMGGVERVEASMLEEDLRIEVGAVALKLQKAMRVDMSLMEEITGLALPVMIGRDVFRDLVVEIDYPASRCALHAPESFKYSGPGKAVSLHDHSGMWAIDVLIEGAGPARVKIDMGTGNTIELFPAFVAKHKLLDGRSPVSSRAGGGIGGNPVSAEQIKNLIVTVGTLRSLTIAGFELRNLPADFVGEANRGAHEGAKCDGAMGGAVFSRFRVVFDYSRERLYLEPGPDYATRPFRKDRIGLQVILKDRLLEVAYVAPGSPADKAGWKAGALIKAVNGQPMVVEGWRAEAQRWSTSPVGTEIALTDADGKVHKLIAAEYY